MASAFTAEIPPANARASISSPDLPVISRSAPQQSERRDYPFSVPGESRNGNRGVHEVPKAYPLAILQGDDMDEIGDDGSACRAGGQMERARDHHLVPLCNKLFRIETVNIDRGKHHFEKAATLFAAAIGACIGNDGRAVELDHGIGMKMFHDRRNILCAKGLKERLG